MEVCEDRQVFNVTSAMAHSTNLPRRRRCALGVTAARASSTDMPSRRKMFLNKDNIRASRTMTRPTLKTRAFRTMMRLTLTLAMSILRADVLGQIPIAASTQSHLLNLLWGVDQLIRPIWCLEMPSLATMISHLRLMQMPLPLGALVYRCQTVRRKGSRRRSRSKPKLSSMLKRSAIRSAFLFLVRRILSPPRGLSWVRVIVGSGEG